jgi:hypothetical protein
MARATERVAVLMTPEEKQALQANLKQVKLSGACCAAGRAMSVTDRILSALTTV